MDDKRTCSVISFLSHRNAHMFEEHNENYMLLKENLLKEMIRVIETASVIHFSTSIEYGLGLSIAEIVLELKMVYPYITLECVIPYETISDKWTPDQRDRYFSILERCDEKTILLKHCTSDYKERCNGYLIRQSQFIITVDAQQAGETDKIIMKIEHTKEISRIKLQTRPNSDCLMD